MKLTAEVMRKSDVYKNDVEKFESRWPNGMETTQENMRELAMLLPLSLDQIFKVFLPFDVYEVYEKKMVDLERMNWERTRVASNIFFEDTRLAWRVYRAAIAPFAKIVDRARDKAFRIFEREKLDIVKETVCSLDGRC